MKIVVATVLALAALPAGGQPVHPMVGIWGGALANDWIVELFVPAVGAKGQATGLVCTHDGTETVIIDFGPTDHTIEGRVDGPALVIPGNAKAHTLRFTPSDSGPGEAQLVATPPGPDREPLRVDLKRRATRGCSAGVALRARTSRPPAVPSDRPAGTWLGTWRDGLGVEVTIEQSAGDGTLRGLYCNLRATAYSFYRLSSGSANAVPVTRTQGGGIEFEIRNTRFAFTPIGEDLRFAHRRGSRTRTLVLKRTAAPWCASQVGR